MIRCDKRRLSKLWANKASSRYYLVYFFGVISTGYRDDNCIAQTAVTVIEKTSAFQSAKQIENISAPLTKFQSPLSAQWQVRLNFTAPFLAQQSLGKTSHRYNRLLSSWHRIYTVTSSFDMSLVKYPAVRVRHACALRYPQLPSIRIEYAYSSQFFVIVFRLFFFVQTRICLVCRGNGHRCRVYQTNRTGEWHRKRLARLRNITGDVLEILTVFLVQAWARIYTV